jgi:hypothetical protein
MRLAPADLLPPGAQLIAATVADVWDRREPAVILVYRWPIGPTFDDAPDRGDLHLRIEPVRGAEPVLPTGVPDGPVTLLAADLQGDGRREGVILPRWDGALRFASNGLAAWPQIIGGGISFYGGALASAVNGALYFNSLRPTLYYAGPKQATFADVDGDGRWEIDVAYSLEDGATVWQVDRYRWQNVAYRYAETYTRPATEPLAPDRYRALIRALEPLPVFAPFGKGQLAVRDVQILAQQVVQADADGDGQVETLLAYLIHPRYGEVMWDRFPNGLLGLAIFGADDSLRARFPEETLEFLSNLNVTVQPVALAPNQPGLLFYRERTLQGSGAIWNDDLVLYRWDAGVWRQAWQGLIAGGGAQGAGQSGRVADAAWLEDVDGDAQAELLFHRTVRQLATGPAAPLPSRWTQNYTLALPGAVALRFDGTTYTPAYLVTARGQTRIRPRQPLFYAPRLSQPVVLDGDPSDWEQIEYHRQLTFAVGGSSPSLLRVAWDDLNLYLAAPVTADRAVLIALDTDLAGDFSSAALDADDWLLELVFPVVPRCAGPVTAHVLHPPQAAIDVRAAIRPAPQHTDCELELAIPLATLGLDGRSLVRTPGWVAGSPDPQAGRDYRPTAGRVMGLAAGDETRPLTAPFRRDDPTTWTTLVFMADR